MTTHLCDKCDMELFDFPNTTIRHEKIEDCLRDVVRHLRNLQTAVIEMEQSVYENKLDL